MSTLHALEPGTELENGRYRIIEMLGHGGFSIVYRAQHYKGSMVAIKELFPITASRKSFFGLWKRKSVRKTRDWRDLEHQTRSEFQLVRSLKHPNIVQVHELFEENNTIYIVMEYIDGKTLHDVLHDFPTGLTEPEAVRVGSSIGDAVGYSHAKGILHRDVKPSNIMIANDGRVVLLDFGVAKTVRVNEARTRIGTEAYMAPEQLRRQAQTPGVDVYGLAATVYHALTGQVPPRPDVRRKHDELVPPRTVKPDVSQTVSNAIMGGLALNPAKRYRTMQAFTNALRGQTAPVERKTAVAEDHHSGWYKSIVIVVILALIALVWSRYGNENKPTPGAGLLGKTKVSP